VEREDLTPTHHWASRCRKAKPSSKPARGRREQQMTAFFFTWEMATYLCDMRRVQRSKGDITRRRLGRGLGTIPVHSLRLSSLCSSDPPTQPGTFQSLRCCCKNRWTPELRFLEDEVGRLVSYASPPALTGCLPIDDTLAPATLREQVFTVAERLEQELGDGAVVVIDSCPAEWSRLPIPTARSRSQRWGLCPGGAQPKQGWLRSSPGRAMAFHESVRESEAPVSSKCFAFVQTIPENPNGALECYSARPTSSTKQSTFLSDGRDHGARAPAVLNPHSEHLLRLVPGDDAVDRAPAAAKGLRTSSGMRRRTSRCGIGYTGLDRLKWFCGMERL